MFTCDLGTLWTAIAHAFTAVVGAGILALPWSVAQLGWILGPFVLVFFAIVTYYIATLLCDCYRTPDPVTGKRNHTYIHAVRELLGISLYFQCYNDYGIDKFALCPCISSFLLTMHSCCDGAYKSLRLSVPAMHHR